MATTGKIFKDSSNVHQDQARLLFNYYQQAAERIVKQEEKIEKEIADLESDREKVELKKSDIWKWFLTIILFFMYWVRRNQYDKQIALINSKIEEKKQEHNNIFRDYKVTKMGVAYVPVAQQIAYEDKCFVVDYTGNVDNSKVSLQMSRQNDLLCETMAQMEKLATEAPLVKHLTRQKVLIPTIIHCLFKKSINQTTLVNWIDRYVPFHSV
jgi:hypothetical protein